MGGDAAGTTALMRGPKTRLVTVTSLARKPGLGRKAGPDRESRPITGSIRSSFLYSFSVCYFILTRFLLSVVRIIAAMRKIWHGCVQKKNHVRNSPFPSANVVKC